MKISQILAHYTEVDIVIEGHFHQSKKVGKYISLPSQACQNMVAIIEDNKVIFKAL
jgi:UDP-2,3-diacylglucosamine hydrolase